MNRYIGMTLAMLIVGGCSGRPPWPEVERSASSAAGLDQAIRFEHEELAIDTPEEASETLTLIEAIRLTLANDARIQSAIARTRGAYAQAWQARLLPNPVVNVASRFPLAGGQPIIEAGLAADLLSLLQRPGRISAADHRLRGAGAGAATTVLDVLAEVQDRYAVIQAMEEMTLVLAEQSKLLQRLIELAQARLQAGEGTRLDVTTLQAQQAQLEVQIMEADLERRDSRMQLARLIGKPSDSMQWRVSPWQEPKVMLGDEPAWIKAALERRPEIQSQLAELSALGVEVKLAHLAFLDGTETGIESERDGGDWSLGPSLTLPLPLMDWGQARGAKMKARRLEAMHELTQTRRQVIEEVRRAYAAYRSSGDTLTQARDRWIPLLERQRQESQAAYQAGESDIIPVFLAQQEFQSGRAKLIEKERQTLQSLIRLHRAVGGPGVVADIDGSTSNKGSTHVAHQ